MASVSSFHSSSKRSGHKFLRLPCFAAIVCGVIVAVPLTQYYFAENEPWDRLTWMVIMLGITYLLLKVFYHAISDEWPILDRHVWGMKFYALTSLVLFLVGALLGPAVLSRYGDDYANFFFIIATVSAIGCFVVNVGHHWRSYRAKKQ